MNTKSLIIGIILIIIGIIIIILSENKLNVFGVYAIIIGILTAVDRKTTKDSKEVENNIRSPN